ncbi:DUF6292 family protein [Actinokineospora guangxiensis]|uniref:DUF6292 family protein n=1 Tax=Actinokineospora guangxiensis TaxID=1490288 RepID=A0ABW0EU36_9PSEU
MPPVQPPKQHVTTAVSTSTGLNAARPRHRGTPAPHSATQPGATPPSASSDDALATALRAYVHAVAAAAGVPADGVTCEVTDTATAYLPLGRRSASHPDHDLMLVWGERRGWAVLLETPPGDPPVALGALGGDAVVAPAEVARFVSTTVASPRPGCRLPGAGARPDRTRLAARLRCLTSEGRR